MKRYICAYMGPGESNCQGWQMPLHALPTQIVFTRVILVIIFLSGAPRTVTFQQQVSFEGTRSSGPDPQTRLLETDRSESLCLSTVFSLFMLVCFQTEECPRNIRIVVGTVNIRTF